MSTPLSWKHSTDVPAPDPSKSPADSVPYNEFAGTATVAIADHPKVQYRIHKFDTGHVIVRMEKQAGGGTVNYHMKDGVTDLDEAKQIVQQDADQKYQ
jgi:hypothetical protein